jgi:hypothetical protein
MKKIISMMFIFLMSCVSANAGILEESPAVKITTRKFESAPVSTSKVRTISGGSNITIQQNKNNPKEEIPLSTDGGVTLLTEKDRETMQYSDTGLVPSKTPQPVQYMEPDGDYYGNKINADKAEESDVAKRLSSLEKKVGALEQKINDLSKQPPMPTFSSTAPPNTPAWTPPPPPQDDQQ